MKPIIQRYKIPLLISLVIALGVIVFSGVGYWLDALLAFVGAFVGMFILDLEYIINAYIVNPTNENSQVIKSFLNKRNVNGFFDYLNNNEYLFGEMSIRSVLFQVIFVIFGFYVAVGGVGIFATAAIFSLFANMLYVQLIELQKTGTLRRWFWIYKGHMDKKAYYTFWVVMLVIFIFEFMYI